MVNGVDACDDLAFCAIIGEVIFIYHRPYSATADVAATDGECAFFSDDDGKGVEAYVLASLVLAHFDGECIVIGEQLKTFGICKCTARDGVGSCWQTCDSL